MILIHIFFFTYSCSLSSSATFEACNSNHSLKNTMFIYFFLREQYSLWMYTYTSIDSKVGIYIYKTIFIWNIIFVPVFTVTFDKILCIWSYINSFAHLWSRFPWHSPRPWRPSLSLCTLLSSFAFNSGLTIRTLAQKHGNIYNSYHIILKYMCVC